MNLRTRRATSDGGFHVTLLATTSGLLASRHPPQPVLPIWHDLMICFFSTAWSSDYGRKAGSVASIGMDAFHCIMALTRLFVVSGFVTAMFVVSEGSVSRLNN